MHLSLSSSFCIDEIVINIFHHQNTSLYLNSYQFWDYQIFSHPNSSYPFKCSAQSSSDKFKNAVVEESRWRCKKFKEKEEHGYLLKCGMYLMLLTKKKKSLRSSVDWAVMHDIRMLVRSQLYGIIALEDTSKIEWCLNKFHIVHVLCVYWSSNEWCQMH